jgi:murein DD-endopeptidase MepM/ murein hydrolase activator NlpD
MMNRVSLMQALALGTALALVAGCKPVSEFDWDLRPKTGLDTSRAARQATDARPQADDRGILSYPGYQVAVARRGDTVNSVATRVGLDASELAAFNALKPADTLRAGEILALPKRVAAAPTPMATPSGGIMGGPVTTQGIDVTTIATGAIDRAAPATQASAPAAANSAEPMRHKVRRGETAFIIARSYNVDAKALAEWNGLGADMMVREGQYLIIPTSSGAPPRSAQAAEVVTAPGQGTATPVPPSATKPLPTRDEPPVAVATATGTTAAAPKPAGTPTSPDLGQTRSSASASRLAMPVDGSIIRPYSKGKNDGIDISAPAGSPVRAAADGTVAAITKDTDQVQILVIKHANNLLTVYGGIDGVTLAKGAAVKRGQTVAKVRASGSPFLHFEVRQGFDSTDPMPFLQ